MTRTRLRGSALRFTIGLIKDDMMMNLPNKLRDARTVGVYSPSGPFSDTESKIKQYERGLNRLRGHGFDVQESSHCRSSWFHMSAPAKDRASDLHALANDRSVSLILPSIGGHVAAQMFEHLDFDALGASGTAIFGFSDNSTIPFIISALTGAVTFHSLCDVTFGFGRFEDGGYDRTESNWLDVVRHQRFDLGGSRSWRALADGCEEGTVLGGNLRSLLTVAGTRWWPDWKDVVLFWEAGNSLHTVQQDLTQLSNGGVFDDLAGMVIGRASLLTEDFYRSDQIMPLDLFLLDVLGLRGRFPIVVEADIGHDIENVTIPLGVRTRLTVADGSVEWSVV